MVKTAEIKEQIIKIPENVDITFENNKLTATGDKGSLSRIFSNPKIEIKVKGKENIVLTCKTTRRKDRALLGTYIAHIKNMIKGVSVGFEYKMKTVFSHFPIKTSVEGGKFVIQNFLGERAARTAKILEGVTVEAKGEDITVQGIDKEKVGQTVANIERATEVKYRDVRVFQDGIYRISKGGS
jgi:large subunit ribosomal protein L6